VIVEEDRIVHWSAKGPAGSNPGSNSLPDRASGNGAADPAGINHALHAAQYADFLAAARTGRPPLVDGHEGRKSVALIATIYESARQQRALPVTD
jgi:UDP-N-acetyl-2-amino-2-deoxyglucuronate dehydrogenase